MYNTHTSCVNKIFYGNILKILEKYTLEYKNKCINCF